MGMRKASVVLLAAVHLLQASWLLQGGIDVLFPRTAVVEAPAADACCVGTCGCPVREQQRKACCCFPAQAPVPQAAAPVAVPILAFDEALCTGATGDVGPLLQSPAVPAFVPVLSLDVRPIAFALPERRPRASPADRALDKVPL